MAPISRQVRARHSLSLSPLPTRHSPSLSSHAASAVRRSPDSQRGDGVCGTRRGFWCKRSSLAPGGRVPTHRRSRDKPSLSLERAPDCQLFALQRSVQTCVRQTYHTQLGFCGTTRGGTAALPPPERLPAVPKPESSAKCQTLGALCVLAAIHSMRRSLSMRTTFVTSVG